MYPTLPHCLRHLPDDILSPGMIPCAAGELAQFLGRLQRLAHAQPQFGALYAHGILQREIGLRSFHVRWDNLYHDPERSDIRSLPYPRDLASG